MEPLRMSQKVVEHQHIINYLDRVERERKLKPAELARRADLSPATISRLRSGQRAARTSTLRAIESASGIPLPPELLDAAAGLAQMHAAPPPARRSTLAAEDSARRFVPVFALIGAPLPGAFYRNEHAADLVARLPGIEHSDTVYAVRMPDDSMAPWRRPNELVFVEPIWAVGVGDHCLVERLHPADDDHPHPMFQVRQFLGLGRTGYRLRRHAGEGDETVPQREVASLRRVLEWHEVTGVR